MIRPQTVVEIGRLAGVSSEWILSALEDNMKGHLYSVDIKTRPEAVERLAPWINKGAATLYEFDSHGPQSEELAKTLGTIDFLFIDGCHTPEAVEADCRTWLPRVKGYVLFHDWAFEGVRVGIRRAVPFDKFPRYVASYEHRGPNDTHFHGHGWMILHLPDGLNSMPAEPVGRPG